MEPLGLYIHIPFCKAKCAYCDFYSLPGCTEERVDAYTEALCAHLRAFAARLRGTENHHYTVDTVYLGGGTPSYLGPRRLLDIWDTVVREYPVAPDTEVTLEANPDSCGDWLASLRSAGFNRISLGMQSADDSELREIGRVHTAAQTRAAVETVRRAGYGNLSLDLIYGLPRQDMERWRENVRAALSLSPEHLSCYGLKAEPGTPLYGRWEAAGLPGDEEQAEFYLWAVEALDRAGYGQYEISNFARPGRASRHNLKYWTLAPYIGFGPGAHSDFGGARYAWGRDLDGYIRAVQYSIQFPGTGLPYAEYTDISAAERARERVMLGLRTAAGLEAGEIPASALPFLEQCRRAGYAVRETGSVCETGSVREVRRWRLTRRGFLVSNQIIGRLLDLWE